MVFVSFLLGYIYLTGILKNAHKIPFEVLFTFNFIYKYFSLNLKSPFLKNICNCVTHLTVVFDEGITILHLFKNAFIQILTVLLSIKSDSTDYAKHAFVTRGSVRVLKHGEKIQHFRRNTYFYLQYIPSTRAMFSTNRYSQTQTRKSFGFMTFFHDTRRQS